MEGVWAELYNLTPLKGINEIVKPAYMKKGLFILLTLSMGLFLMVSCMESNENHKTRNMNEEKTALLRHVVIFKFKDTASEAEVQKISDHFNRLPEAISVIKDFEWGLNDSPENFHQGFTHCYMLTFNSEKDRDSVYTPHPAHQEFVASLQPHLEKVFVVDYWTK